MKFPISLQGFSTLNTTCFYEPELFPGAIFKMLDPKLTFLIFSSGKVCITGAKTREDAKTGFDKIYTILRKFRRRNPSELIKPIQAETQTKI